VFVSVATLLHADADAFFASVEQRDDPKLRGKPTVVGGGVVMAASYEARAFGIHGGMGGGKARRLCPQLQVVSPNFDAYTDASRALFALFRDTSPVVEGLSLEEAFLDVRGLEHISGTPVEIGRRLRERTRAEIGLPLTVGIARTRVVAKMASRRAKPDGLLEVPGGRESEFLHPLRVGELWGVGESTATKLVGAGIVTVGQLAAAPVEQVMAAVGHSAGRHLHAVANGRELPRLRPRPSRRSFGAQSALGRRSRTPAAVDAALISLVDRVTRRMREKDRAGRTVTLRLRFGDYTRATRSRTMAKPTAGMTTILAVAQGLLAEARPVIRERGITLVGIAISNLQTEAERDQLRLAVDPPVRALDAAVDEIRRRYGPEAVRRAVILGREDPFPWLHADDPGLQPPEER
jgi:DNA polymerase-4